jgi:lipopolysaccharide/colanic/teichoic acid biosynthesis glycosyltransferase
MLELRIPQPRVRRGVFHSFRFQMAFVVLCGVAVPALVALGISGVGIVDSVAAQNALLFVALAAAGLVYVVRRLGLFPGNGVAKYILPALAVMYLLVFATIAVLRLEYSNTILLVGFFSTLAARYAVTTINLRGPQQIYYVVPGGRVQIVEELPMLLTVRLKVPEMPALPHAVVVADLHHDHPPEWERFLAEAAISGTSVYHYKQIWEACTGQVRMEHLSENSFGALIPGLAYRKLKRLADLSLCVAVLPIVAPVMLVAALLIRLEGGGPILFCQERMGYRGKRFKVCKFRTMTTTHDGNDIASSMTHADDARITRLGHFLRRTRIDELPQFWNIVRGEMSWIGPRPEAISLSHWYEGELPFYRYRHIVRPGITGWAQVNQGHVCSLSDVDHKLQFDFFYIKNISYWMDILVLFKTIRVILTGFGAK